MTGVTRYLSANFVHMWMPKLACVRTFLPLQFVMGDCLAKVI